MKQATKHPRKTRTYKVTDVVYKKARQRAKREKTTLAEMVEKFTLLYGAEAIHISSIPVKP